nr:MAG: hypothetical protein J07AB56_08620 [Candidatus Nanosalinarum sp. J07AB56]
MQVFEKEGQEERPESCLRHGNGASTRGEAASFQY